MTAAETKSMTEDEKKWMTKEAEEALEQFNRRLDEEYEQQKKFYTFMHRWGTWISGFLAGITIGWICFG